MAAVQRLQAKNRRGRPSKTVGSKKSSTLFNVANHVRGKSECEKRMTEDDLYENDRVQSDVKLRAMKVRDNLGLRFPTQIKVMWPSQVSGGFWLGLHTEFCVKHMPNKDTMFVLEDENGETSDSKYLAEKKGLSGGWRAFSINHKLVKGDVLVFQLVKQAKLKVHIVRVRSSEEVDGVLGLLELAPSRGKMNPSPSIMTAEEMKDEDSQPLLEEEEDHEENFKKKSEKMRSERSISDHSESESEDLGFELSDGIRLAEWDIDFKAVKCFEDFDIIVNGLVITPELSRNLQKKYYDLCCSQNGFLHYHLLPGLNCKLVAGIIAETINIADAIRAYKINTSRDEFPAWKMTLESFEGLGLNVGFLLVRLNHLMRQPGKSQV